MLQFVKQMGCEGGKDFTWWSLIQKFEVISLIKLCFFKKLSS